MRRLFLFLLVLSGPSALDAQWQLGLRHGTATSHGDARADLDPAHAELQAHRPGTWTLSFARELGAWRLGLDVHRTAADLAEVGPSSSVTTSSLLAAWGFGLELSHRIAGRSGAASLLVGGGALIDRWTFDVADNSPRTRVAARGFLEADLAISQQWLGVIRGEVASGASVFRPDELPQGFTTRTATRLGLALGVARRW